jgi:uncharacterized cofD-like protein
VGRALAGHSFGNLFLTALTNITGDFSQAIRVSARVLAIRGRIFPSTAQNVTLKAELENGITIAGETNISRSRKPIARVSLVPRRVRPVREVLDALRDADLILVGPGSLYTSIIPNLLVEEIVDVIANSRATRVYIANLMTQPGETQHYSVADHVRAIYHHTRPGLFDFVVIRTIGSSICNGKSAAGGKRRSARPAAFDAAANQPVRQTMPETMKQQSSQMLTIQAFFSR